MKKFITILVVLTVIIFGFATLRANETQESVKITIPDGIHFGTGEESFITENDTIICLYTVENGLISFSKNDYVVRGHKINKNHPNYGYLQMTAEKYFTQENPQYLSFPTGKIIPDKYLDIKKYGVPSERTVKEENEKTSIILTWKNTPEGAVQHTYDEYGKRIF